MFYSNHVKVLLNSKKERNLGGKSLNVKLKLRNLANY